MARRSINITINGLGRRLKVSQLVIFNRVMETGSLLRAANDLQMTQPAVTKVVQELEYCFEGELFSRTNRGVVPTDLGLLVARRIKSLLAELRLLADEVNDFRGGVTGHVVVGTLISASAHLLPSAIASLKRDAPGVLVTVREGPTVELFSALATGDLDVVVGRLPESELPISNAFPLSHFSLFDDQLCVVAGKPHADGLSAVTALPELEGVPWILPPPESPMRLTADRLFRTSGLPFPADAIESLSMLTNIGLLLEAPRVALMPHRVARQFVRMGLLHVLDLPAIGTFGSVGYSVRAGRDLTPAGQSLIARLRQVAGTVAETLQD